MGSISQVKILAEAVAIVFTQMLLGNAWIQLLFVKVMGYITELTGLCGFGW